ncbi:hypothetical protein CPB84DRAFT_1752383 [Gymnopilus junonius]|uniref:Uncharacterized protein n=1 Tax=Gymnopilus junonius TaxID=109634 RepID=A0A9P5TG35_GYMJU|nr:hypothetical protein CPB84DRAFT_1752383 [Gymnopilus junonius]
MYHHFPALLPSFGFQSSSTSRKFTTSRESCPVVRQLYSIFVNVKVGLSIRSIDQAGTALFLTRSLPRAPNQELGLSFGIQGNGIADYLRYILTFEYTICLKCQVLLAVYGMLRLWSWSREGLKFYLKTISFEIKEQRAAYPAAKDRRGNSSLLPHWQKHFTLFMLKRMLWALLDGRSYFWLYLKHPLWTPNGAQDYSKSPSAACWSIAFYNKNRWADCSEGVEQ